ncbi:MAG: zinc ribbon domain-containing protein [Thermoleophilia bacterium]
MGGFSDRARLSAQRPNSAGDVVVTVAASQVRDAKGKAIQQMSSAPGEAKKAAGELRKERAGLARRYQELRGDLGGLLIEMARRDQFNFHLLRLRASEAVTVEQRAKEIDGALTLHAASGRTALPPGTVAMSSTKCSHCTAAIPVDANFCAYCGTPTQ